KPRLMGSAECRTTDKEGHELSPAAGGGGDDPGLFFPGAGAARDPEPPAPAPEPEAAPAPRAQPPRRLRPPGRSGNIEEDLAADLAALDIGDKGSEEFLQEGRPFSEERSEGDAAEPAGPEALAEAAAAAPAFDDDLDEGFEPDLDPDAPPREPRGRR